jgi:hypothetical protein
VCSCTVPINLTPSTFSSSTQTDIFGDTQFWESGFYFVSSPEFARDSLAMHQMKIFYDQPGHHLASPICGLGCLKRAPLGICKNQREKLWGPPFLPPPKNHRLQQLRHSHPKNLLLVPRARIALEATSPHTPALTSEAATPPSRTCRRWRRRPTRTQWCSLRPGPW